MWNVPTTIEPFNGNVEAYLMESDRHFKFKYMVALSIEGNWTCSCPDWAFRRPENGCKHINRVKAWKRNNPVSIPAVIPQPMPRFAALDV